MYDAILYQQGQMQQEEREQAGQALRLHHSYFPNLLDAANWDSAPEHLSEQKPDLGRKSDSLICIRVKYKQTKMTI